MNVPNTENRECKSSEVERSSLRGRKSASVATEMQSPKWGAPPRGRQRPKYGYWKKLLEFFSIGFIVYFVISMMLYVFYYT